MEEVPEHPLEVAANVSPPLSLFFRRVRLPLTFAVVISPQVMDENCVAQVPAYVHAVMPPI